MKSPLHRMSMMKTLTAIVVCYAILGEARGEEICYEDVGCFPDDPPWSGTLQRPTAKFPLSPAKINTKFFLLTRESPEQHQVISARDLPGLDASSFRTSRKTILVVHGMADKAENNWVSDMCRELLKMEDVNCIGVDWRRGSGNVMQYVQAVNNGRVVGAEISYLLNVLQAEKNYSLYNIHIIGHSLGAHIAGEAGRRSPGIRRITGLDPARLYFENAEPEVRLDPSDAGFVDVIHTDTEIITGVGVIKPIGHFDFYPNGGKHMAGCPNKLQGIFNDLFDALTCNHFRAFLYYTDSIQSPDGYVSYPCDSYNHFTTGACFPCPPQGCPTMGHHSEQSYNINEEKQKFYLNTGGNPPHFSSRRYKVTVTLNGTANAMGKAYAKLHGAGGDASEHELKSGLLVPGEAFSQFIDSPFLLPQLDHVTFRWTPKIFNLFQKELGAAKIDIQTGEDGKTSSFCAQETVLEDVVHTLRPCTDL